MQATIDNIPLMDGGRIGLTACPGLGSAEPAQDRAAPLKADLAAIAAWRADALVTLVEPFELTMLGVEDLGGQVRALGLDWWHLPIVDGAAPGTSFEPAWREAGAGLHAQLDVGGRIVLHCLAGLGRSGEIAARLLIERGMAPDAAIAAVRRARPGAIQTAEQVDWVRACGAR